MGSIDRSGVLGEDGDSSVEVLVGRSGRGSHLLLQHSHGRPDLTEGLVVSIHYRFLGQASVPVAGAVDEIGKTLGAKAPRWEPTNCPQGQAGH